jgi:hypothetical protein
LFSPLFFSGVIQARLTPTYSKQGIVVTPHCGFPLLRGRVLEDTLKDAPALPEPKEMIAYV